MRAVALPAVVPEVTGVLAGDGVLPTLHLEVRVGGIDAGVDDPDHDACTTPVRVSAVELPKGITQPQVDALQLEAAVRAQRERPPARPRVASPRLHGDAHDPAP